MNEFLTAQEVADRLRVSKAWVYAKAREGVLRSHLFGKHLRFGVRDLEEFLEQTVRSR